VAEVSEQRLQAAPQVAVMAQHWMPVSAKKRRFAVRLQHVEADEEVVRRTAVLEEPHLEAAKQSGVEAVNEGEKAAHAVALKHCSLAARTVAEVVARHYW